MAGVYGLIAAISTTLVGSLVEAKLPPLTEGRILVGKRHVSAPTAPPRVVFVPRRSTFSAGGSYGGAARRADNATGLSAERRVQHAQRAVKTEHARFDVHVIGPVAPVDGNQAWDLTQRYYHLVIRALFQDAEGASELFDGDWTEQGGPATQAVQASQEFVFGVAFKTPVLDDALEYVPTGTGQLLTAGIQPVPDGDIETAIEES